MWSITSNLGWRTPTVLAERSNENLIRVAKSRDLGRHRPLARGANEIDLDTLEAIKMRCTDKCPSLNRLGSQGGILEQLILSAEEHFHATAKAPALLPNLPHPQNLE